MCVISACDAYNLMLVGVIFYYAHVINNSIILGDWNSIVGGESYQNIVGSHGLGRRNHRGQMLIDFCERNGLIVTNSWFKKP
jgi:hypothetical protein